MLKKAGMTILRAMLVQMILSVILIAVAAFVVLKMSPSDAVVKGIVLVIYGIASFVGGHILGGTMEKRRFLWGMAAGAIYFGIILLVAFLMKGSIQEGTVGVMAGAVVSLVAGTVGGMIG